MGLATMDIIVVVVYAIGIFGLASLIVLLAVRIPVGLSLATDGELSGTPTAGGSFSLTGGAGFETAIFNGLVTASGTVSLAMGRGADLVQIAATSGLVR